MGKNFYMVFPEETETGERPEVSDADTAPETPDGKRYHIGKSSCGWKFHFAETDKWSSWEEIREYIKQGHPVIDEYGDTITLTELKRKVTCRGKNPKDHVEQSKIRDYGLPESFYHDQEGYVFSRKGYDFC